MTWCRMNDSGSAKVLLQSVITVKWANVSLLSVTVSAPGGHDGFSLCGNNRSISFRVRLKEKNLQLIALETVLTAKTCSLINQDEDHCSSGEQVTLMWTLNSMSQAESVTVRALITRVRESFRVFVKASVKRVHCITVTWLFGWGSHFKPDKLCL